MTYRKKEFGALSNASAEKPRRDVVAGGGDYEDNDYAESYTRAAPQNLHEETKRYQRKTQKSTGQFTRAKQKPIDESIQDKKLHSAASGQDSSDYFSHSSG